MSGFLFNYPGAIVLTLLGVGLGDFIVNAPAGGLAKCVIAGTLLPITPRATLRAVRRAE